MRCLNLFSSTLFVENIFVTKSDKNRTLHVCNTGGKKSKNESCFVFLDEIIEENPNTEAAF